MKSKNSQQCMLSVIVTEPFEDLRKLWTLFRKKPTYEGIYKGFMDPMKPVDDPQTSG